VSNSKTIVEQNLEQQHEQLFHQSFNNIENISEEDSLEQPHAMKFVDTTTTYLIHDDLTAKN